MKANNKSNQNLLVCTSALFLTIVIHAFYVQNAVYHHLFLGVSVLSLAFHGWPDRQQRDPPPLLCLADKALAHVVFIIALLDMIAHLRHMWYLFVMPAAILVLWILEHMQNSRHLRVELHIALHLAGLCTVHLLLWYLPSSK